MAKMIEPNINATAMDVVGATSAAPCVKRKSSSAASAAPLASSMVASKATPIMSLEFVWNWRIIRLARAGVPESEARVEGHPATREPGAWLEVICLALTA